MVEILSAYPPEPLPVWFVVAHRRNLSAKMRAFLVWVETTMQPYL